MNQSLKILLVALDGSTRAGTVFEAAADLARALGGRLVLYRALVVPPDFSAAGGDADLLPRFLEKEATAQLLALKARAPDVPSELRVEEASEAWRAILAAGEAVGADLIILGSHGYHGWDRMLGTTAGKVANRAQRNVMIIHDRDRVSGTLPDGGGGTP